MKIGAIPFMRAPDGGLQFYLVSTTSDPKRFAFPKGHLGDKGNDNDGKGEDWHKGVIREIREEAGLDGRIILSHMPIAIPNRKRPKDGVMYYWVEITAVNDKWVEDTKRHRIVRSGKELMDVKLNTTSKEVLKVFKAIDFNPGKVKPPKDGGGSMGDWLLQQLFNAVDS